MNPNLQVTLAYCVEKELAGYMTRFKTEHQRQVILVFPGNLDEWFLKTIRYFAIMHNLAAIYIHVNSVGVRYLVVFNNAFFNTKSLDSYENLYKLTFQNTEQIEPLHLYSLFLRSSLSFSTMFGRTPLGTKNRESAMIELQKADYGLIFKHYEEDFSLVIATSSLNVNATEFFPSEAVASCSTFPHVSGTYNCHILDLPAAFAELDSKSTAAPHLSPGKESSTNTAKHIYIDALKECVEFMTQLKTLITGTPLLVNSNQEYSVFQKFRQCVLDYVLEVYDIPQQYTALDVLDFFHVQPIYIKWCDESTAILIFSDPEHTKSLRVKPTINFKIRSMFYASPLATVVVSLIDLPNIIQQMNT